MRRFILPALVTLAAVALLALLAFGVAGQGDRQLDRRRRGQGPISARAAAPPTPCRASARTAAESLADLRGRYVLLNVFASWCDPCKAEAPVLEQAQRRLSPPAEPCSA